MAAKRQARMVPWLFGAIAALAASTVCGSADGCHANGETCRPASSVLAEDQLAGQPEYVELLQQSMSIARAETRIAPASAESSPATESTAAPAVKQQVVALQTSKPAVGKKAKANATDANTTAPSGPTTTTLPPTGMTMNAEGDFSAFMASTVTNVFTWFGCVATFCFLRVHYPRMYSNNVLLGTAPGKPDVTSHFSWAKAAFCYTIPEAIESMGLDHAMMLEFTHLCMKLCLIIGMPMLFIMAPMHYFLGGHAAGSDRLSYLSFGNIEDNSWLYWIHPVVVWGVVFTVQVSIYKAQANFLGYRYEWLRRMGSLRANTVLVEGIPPAHQSDEALKTFFDTILGGNKVETAYVAKDSKGLVTMVADLQTAKHSLTEAQALERQDPANPPMMKESVIGNKVKAVDHWAKVIEELEPKIETLRKAVREDSAKIVGSDGGNCSCGFVTFKERSNAEIALRLNGLTADEDEFIISTPPTPHDILWADLTQDVTVQEGRTVTGYLAVAGLYFAYMPMVIGITNVAKGIDLGPLQPFWAGLAPTFGLTIMVSFLPTFLRMIFENFFTLKAAAWTQHKLHIWYFWFQVVFVLLATAVGQDVGGFTKAILTEPKMIFMKVAETMPYATHFYMNFLVMQWVTHSMNIMRYINLTKYLSFRTVFEDEVAASMAEPEDQDYYGMGSRSARWTINMSIAIVFGTICPPMLILALINFAICRLIYGYLMPYAETRKADLGGEFWVTKLNHLFFANMLYIVLMTSVLLERSDSNVPAIMTASSLVYVIWSRVRFSTAFNWRKLPFQELMIKEDLAEVAKLEKREIGGKYMQPELYPEAK